MTEMMVSKYLNAVRIHIDDCMDSRAEDIDTESPIVISFNKNKIHVDNGYCIQEYNIHDVSHIEFLEKNKEIGDE